MIKSLVNAFKVKDIRVRLYYTLMMVVLIRIGSNLPIPGIDTELVSTELKRLFENSGGAFDFLSAVTGGSFEKVSVFALSITPYITSSIIMQLLTIAIPKLEEMQKESEEGRKKIAEVTRYLTVVLALAESIGMAVSFKNSNWLGTENVGFKVASIILTLTAGSAVLMWIGERITEKGVGNGISIVLLVNIVSRIPNDMGNLFSQFVTSESNPARAILAACVIIFIIVAMVVYCVILQDGERRIPAQYSSKLQGRRSYGGQQTNIPLKVNTAGVMPIIFASSLMQTPVVVYTFIKGGSTPKALRYLSQQYWINPDNWKYSLGLIVYLLLVVFFAYFYTSISFNPNELADNMKKSGGFIPGVRPGKPTIDYLNNILKYIIFIGALALAVVAVVPMILSGVFKANISFFGTSIIIIVGVVLETIKKVESQMVVRNYQGFLDD
ncbi:MAG: preprotein translocase subunit SecY [Lachnospiraceae bacterium]|nr:preprotein translocase subunit SecY [Lachnospiraceae bacterium]